MLKKIVKKVLKVVQTPLIFFDYFAFNRLSNKKRFNNSIFEAYPCIKDKTVQTGFDRHYVYFTAWAARVLEKIMPLKHVDISSSLFFSGIVSAFIPVDFYDYRPAELYLSGFESKQADLLKLPFSDNSINSLSCMHVIEHIGLGRYGDPLDYEGDIKAIHELKRVLSPGGSLLFVVPMGNTARIEFNAHRIYTLAQIKEYFSDLEIAEFSFIPEKSGAIIKNATEIDLKNEYYGAGCFHFIKK